MRPYCPAIRFLDCHGKINISSLSFAFSFFFFFPFLLGRTIQNIQFTGYVLPSQSCNSSRVAVLARPQGGSIHNLRTDCIV